MSGVVPLSTQTLSPPLPRLCLGVTGHREGNPALAANRVAVIDAITGLFDRIDAQVEALGQRAGRTRLHSVLADGVDQISAWAALERGWELVAPLPFGGALNCAISAHPTTAADAAELIHDGTAADEAVQTRALAIRSLYDRARLFELADRDERLAALYLTVLENADDKAAAVAFEANLSARVASAGRITIEQSDFLIGVWDGHVRNLPGGTGHTICAALEAGTPVIVIDPVAVADWTILTVPESLKTRPRVVSGELREELVAGLIRSALGVGPDGRSSHLDTSHSEEWQPRSSSIWTHYRRIEAVAGGEAGKFGSLRQIYEAPDAIALGSAAPVLEAVCALPGADKAVAEGIGGRLLPQFAMADGISARLSDAYRSGMVANFMLSALAIIAGAAYLPTGLDEQKWAFAAVEFVLLCAILAITWRAGRRRWHARWLETRRYTEYLRHAPIMLPLGVARPASRWPRGKGASWPEHFARHELRAIGLPATRVSRPYLVKCLRMLIQPHVLEQRDYHRAKGRRLAVVHHRLDRLAESCFVLALAAVTFYLLAWGGAAVGLLPNHWSVGFAKISTYFAVALPALGACVAGIRFFGDFERFGSISNVAAEKLDSIAGRVELLLAGPEDNLDYEDVAGLSREIDEAVLDEIESWQAVFGSKPVSLPV